MYKRTHHPIAASAEGNWKSRFNYCVQTTCFHTMPYNRSRRETWTSQDQITYTTFFHTIQKFQVVPLVTYCPWSYQTNCSQSWGFHPRRQRRYTDYLSPPRSLTNLVTCTALSYLSSQSILFTSLLDWNQGSGCCQSLFNPQLTHPKTLLLELGFCMLLLKNDLFNNL